MQKGRKRKTKEVLGIETNHTGPKEVSGIENGTRVSTPDGDGVVTAGIPSTSVNMVNKVEVLLDEGGKKSYQEREVTVLKKRK